MKRTWTDQELQEFWSLSDSDRALLKRYSKAGRLGFVVQLKYLENAGCFPSRRADIPATILSFLAKQLNLTVKEIGKYDWNGRTSRIHRAKIREFLGYREPTTEDAEQLSAWLIGDVRQGLARFANQ